MPEYNLKYLSDVEQKVLQKLFDVAKAHGYLPYAHNATDDGMLAPVETEEEAALAVDSVEECFLKFHIPSEPTKRFGALLILGNGTDLLSDFSAPPDHFHVVDQLMVEIQDYADSLSG